MLTINWLASTSFREGCFVKARGNCLVPMKSCSTHKLAAYSLVQNARHCSGAFGNSGYRQHLEIRS